MKMSKIEVSEAALDTLQRMVEELQAERDALLSMVKKLHDEFAGLPPSLGYEFDYMLELSDLIAKCNG